MNTYEWHGFGKFWLWLCLIVNAIILIIDLVGVAGSIVLGGTAALVISVIAEALIIYGIVKLLFKKQKKGFYFIVVAAILALIMNIAGGNAASGIVGCILSLGIMYLAIRKALPYLD